MGGQVVITLNKQAEIAGEAFIQACKKKKTKKKNPQSWLSVMVPKWIFFIYFFFLLLLPIGGFTSDSESTTNILCIMPL